jgi:hypothetical protein
MLKAASGASRRGRYSGIFGISRFRFYHRAAYHRRWWTRDDIGNKLGFIIVTSHISHPPHL